MKLAADAVLSQLSAVSADLFWPIAPIWLLSIKA
jgi:hypothetical protein